MRHFMSENKRILNLPEKKFSDLENFQENSTVFKINTNASLKNLEIQWIISGGITQIPHGNQDLHNMDLLNLHIMPPLLSSNHQPPTPSPVEQAILSLSKIVDNFIEEQRAVTVQANQEIDTIESSLDKELGGFQ